MFLQQHYLGCLAHASYLIADEVTGTAVLVDPQRDIDQYVTDRAAPHELCAAADEQSGVRSPGDC